MTETSKRQNVFEGIHRVGKLPGINVLRVPLGPVQKNSYFLCYVNIYIIHLLLFLLLLFHCCHCHFVLFLVFNISISSALCINS